MPRRLAIVQGHPDPAGNRLCHALADAYAEGAAATGHQVMRIEVARLDFPILRTQRDFETGQVPESLVEARDAIVSAQHVSMIFPLWHGTMPALLKAFIEQVMRPGPSDTVNALSRRDCSPGARRGSSSRWACRRRSTGGTFAPMG